MNQLIPGGLKSMINLLQLAEIQAVSAHAEVALVIGPTSFQVWPLCASFHQSDSISIQIEKLNGYSIVASMF